MTLSPVMKPLREAVVKTSPHAWVKKAVKRKKPMMIPGFRNSPDQVFRRPPPDGQEDQAGQEETDEKKVRGRGFPQRLLDDGERGPPENGDPEQNGISGEMRRGFLSSAKTASGPEMSLIVPTAEPADQSESTNQLTLFDTLCYPKNRINGTQMNVDEICKTTDKGFYLALEFSICICTMNADLL